MKKLSRREFIGTGAMGLLAATQLRAEDLATRRLDVPISFQSWGMKDQLSEDFDGTLAKVREIGYEGMEMCSPRSYGQFAFLQSVPPEELGERIRAAGLFCETCHFQATETMPEQIDATIEYAGKMGLENVTMSSAGLGRDASFDEWKAFAEKANTSGQRVKDAGMQFVYHNHAIGPVYDGTPLYDHLMSMFDPELVKMQFQLASIAGGYDLVEYLTKYAGRYVALHIHDWSPEEETIVPVGDGVIDWKALVAAARKSDIADHGWIVEIETDEPFEGLVRSYDYLSKLNV